MNNQHNNQPQQNQANQQQGNGPVDTLWDGSLKLAIFQNQHDKGISYAMEPGRIYTDNQGQIREAKSFSPTESLRMARLHERGYERVNEFRQQMKSQRQDQNRER